MTLTFMICQMMSSVVYAWYVLSVNGEVMLCASLSTQLHNIKYFRYSVIVTASYYLDRVSRFSKIYCDQCASVYVITFNTIHFITHVNGDIMYYTVFLLDIELR